MNDESPLAIFLAEDARLRRQRRQFRRRLLYLACVLMLGAGAAVGLTYLFPWPVALVGSQITAAILAGHPPAWSN